MNGFAVHGGLTVTQVYLPSSPREFTLWTPIIMQELSEPWPPTLQSSDWMTAQGNNFANITCPNISKLDVEHIRYWGIANTKAWGYGYGWPGRGNLGVPLNL